MQIELDKTHTYHVDGVVWPGVTQVLASAGLVNGQWFTEESRRRGQYVHLMTKLHDLGTLNEDAVSDDMRPYLDAWKRFREESKCEILAVEERVANETYRYAGTLDRRIILAGHHGAGILDLKTGSPESWHAIQTAAYAFTRPDYYRRFALYLGLGVYKLVEHLNRTDRDIFIAALNIHNWKERHGNSSN